MDLLNQKVKHYYGDNYKAIHDKRIGFGLGYYAWSLGNCVWLGKSLCGAVELMDWSIKNQNLDNNREENVNENINKNIST
jgi:hypothetical protein